MLFLLKSRKTVCELRKKMRINYFTNEKNRFNKRFSSNTYGAPDGARTHNLLIRNQIRYPVAPRARNVKIIPLNEGDYKAMKENVRNIRLIVCDIDNTLLPAGHDALSRYTVKALHKAMDNGYQLMICTGRHYTFIPPSFFDDLPMDIIGTINGACLVDRSGKVIDKHPMSLEDMNAITNLCIAHGIGLGFKFEDAIVTYANYDKFMKGYVRNPREWKLVINDDEKRTHHLTAGTPLGTFIIGDESVIEPFSHTLPDLIFAWSQRDGYDVFSRNVTKATAVQRVLDDEGLSWDNVLAFGDAGNDIPFIEKAGIGVALGNAKDGVKEHADLSADLCENDGVAKMLEQLGII